MAGDVKHDYHLVDPSPWPLVGSIAVLMLAIGGVGLMHDRAYSGYLFALGLIGVLYTMYEWWSDVVRESLKGDHTPVVQIGLRYGMILFIASEVMFFVAWFWAYFNAALFPTEQMGSVWPPEGIVTFDPWHIPYVNTLILLLSGTSVTWAHHALLHGDRQGLKQGLWATVLLGAFFSVLQVYEYSVASFGMSSGIYGSTFFMATGFHGFHVFVGTLFLLICLIRAYRGHFTPEKHFGFEAAAWYWHFVDVVWLFLFASIYIWGAGSITH
ncbi:MULTISPECIES: cytochrome c oxidase subunit 3 [unclassified Iodidimonas]|jgi:cytochrome c oxidase subunit 3|uniref:cytochrome c oxidase subunit 3 n=1 Tax=unclassified Iodidimonas TaxID=2626145 RepID=UPI0024824F17|nr:MULTISPECIES: cytochrome c oxidase subunit 3 [unclassified Iodidimonas]